MISLKIFSRFDFYNVLRDALGRSAFVWLAAVFLCVSACSSGSYKGLDVTPDAGTTGCQNGVRDGKETDLDCGGNCPSKCADRAKCSVDGDCQSAKCVGGTCAPPACDDNVRNGTESDKDCGGTCMPCPVGGQCDKPEDCKSLSCPTAVCVAPTCIDGIQNQGEAFVDCGGPCQLCAANSPCSDSGACQSGVCNGTCQAASCTDGVTNGSETDVDCGGGTCPQCAVSGKCVDGPRDCQNGVCTNSVCQAAHCTDRVKNGGETDVDCGGPDCSGCADGKTCAGNPDCASKVCMTSVCQAPRCDDLVKNGLETDVDCGGTDCTACQAGQICSKGSDCASLVCTATPGPGLTCQLPSCVPPDGAQNGSETDVDCGGASCPKCPGGSVCVTKDDCLSGVCRSGLCQLATCQDVVQNGLASDMETDVDCGGMIDGSCGGTAGRCSRCDVARSCSCGGDCLSGVCAAVPGPGLTCQAPSCNPPDTVKNQNETDVDCGGANNCPRCGNGGACAVGTDCASKVCAGGICRAPACPDGQQNGSETDVDCGKGSCTVGCCATLCANGQKCQLGTDCTSGNCAGGFCVSVSTCGTMPACPKDACETDCNCGGCCGATCATSQNCSGPSDCVSGVCTSGKCQAPTCSDGVKNGSETDQDCGGTTCVSLGKKCPTSQKCGVPTDCQSGVCVSGICQAPSCLDGVQNGLETDVDCGGSCSTKCANGLKCNSGADCANSVCGANNNCPSPPCTCQAPTCSDTVKNQNESDTDCGGICGPTCAVGRTCNGNGDCSTGNCQSGTCGAVACNGAGETQSGSSCYRYVQLAKTWTDAQADCQAWGGSLVSINSAAENALIDTIRARNTVWLGFNDLAVEGTFVWVNGDPVTYTNWDGGEPNNSNGVEDCAQMWRTKGYWNDGNCSFAYYFVCERPL